MFIQTLARILADKFDLEVRYSDTAQTFQIGRNDDGSLFIVLASRLLEASGEKEEAIGSLFRGALAHEALGHGRHTDFSSEALASEGAYARSLANAFEDVRIEALAPETFPGARRLLSEMVRVLLADFDFWAPPAEKDWQDALLIGLLRKYRAKILRQPIDPAVTEQILQQAIAVIGIDLFKNIDSLAESACRSGSTKEVSDYADQIVRLLRKNPREQQPPEPPKQEQGGAGDSDESDGAGGNDGGDQEQGDQQGGGKNAGDDKGDGKPSGGKPQDADDEPSEGSSGNAPGSDTEGGSDQAKGGQGQDGKQQSSPGRSSGDHSAPPSPFDDQRTCKVDIEAAMEAVSDPANGNLVSTGLEAGFADRTEHLDKQLCTIDLSSCNRLAGRIASRLESALRSITEDADDEESDLGRLDLSRLPAIAAGATTRPFITDGRPGHGINTEIMLVMDQSDSMNEIGAGILRELLCASLAALARFSPDLGISVAAFDVRSALMVRPGRHITPLVAAKVASAYMPNGGTRWARSVAPLVPILAQSPRHRRVLLTVTDGQIEATRNPALMRDIAYHQIACHFVTIGGRVPEGFKGVACVATPESFANAFCEAILQTLPAEYA